MSLLDNLNQLASAHLKLLDVPTDYEAPMVNGKPWTEEDYKALQGRELETYQHYADTYGGWIAQAALMLLNQSSMAPVYGSYHHSARLVGQALLVINEELSKK
jgi:hypothetical protein